MEKPMLNIVAIPELEKAIIEEVSKKSNYGLLKQKVWGERTWCIRTRENIRAWEKSSFTKAKEQWGEQYVVDKLEKGTL